MKRGRRRHCDDDAVEQLDPVIGRNDAALDELVVALYIDAVGFGYEVAHERIMSLQ
jgi:hypothetical protein